MTGSRRAFLAIASLAVAASVFDATAAIAASRMHVPGPVSAVHAEERSRVTNRHFPNAHRVQSHDHVDDPFADMVLG
jgi:hypothetical protein